MIAQLREATGSAHYGVFGMSGNLWEYVVSAGTSRGRRFVGEHGTGVLDSGAGPGLDAGRSSVVFQSRNREGLSWGWRVN